MLKAILIPGLLHAKLVISDQECPGMASLRVYASFILQWQHTVLLVPQRPARGCSRGVKEAVLWTGFDDRKRAFIFRSLLYYFQRSLIRRLFNHLCVGDGYLYGHPLNNVPSQQIQRVRRCANQFWDQLNEIHSNTLFASFGFEYDPFWYDQPVKISVSCTSTLTHPVTNKNH